MKINKSDLMSDELWKYTMVDGQKKYVRRVLDINKDSKVGQADFWSANINPDYIKPAEDTITNLPKELPWGGPNINVSKSNAYNTYRPKPPQGVQGWGYVSPIPKNVVQVETPKPIENKPSPDINTSTVITNPEYKSTFDWNNIINPKTLLWDTSLNSKDIKWEIMRAQNMATSAAWSAVVWINSKMREYQDALNYVNSKQWITLVNQEDINKYNKAQSIIKNYR